MTTSSDFRAIALALDGTTEAPHFDRQAFKVARTYATLAADGLTANLKLTPDEQEFKAMLAPEAFVPIDNGWGRQGWTTAILARLSAEELKAALEMAYAHALPKVKTRKRTKTKGS
ncbi:hypothetical protein ASC89_07675 [Devosia sp. Root413D1]|uniref:MmcQ/YjbR family DNA-binding protein n=1 Tax=unclassified Devosia TaxID=196773 RepID=UPI0006F42576|nr:MULTISPECIES: MmcQ/YjbR family DNA-binding protein [unclassified Devosia]KQU96395.1 hypothetical protein ASC68_13525 [Devosia sp. Root105]KQW81676.1 hypothetical protein ASC89_07675 [Devosia sp. Root413D1]